MNTLPIIQTQIIENKIYEVREQKVMLDFDLAELYEVETKRINEAVRRNMERFPERFMFRLKQEEWETMRSQIATAYNQRKRNIFAFTEHGVTMLSIVLRNNGIGRDGTDSQVSSHAGRANCFFEL